MIGSALKKLAKENGMKVSNGVAYGALRGYAVTLQEGSGYKRMDISTRFSDVSQQEQMKNAVNAVDLKRTYRVQTMEIGQRFITVVFSDTMGTIKKVNAFIEWFFPLLDRFNAARANTCAECGGGLTAGNWLMIGGIAHHMHPSCAQKVKEELATEQETQRSERKGSYATGLLGALLGALVGAVVWAAVLYAGYVASLVGLLIGFLAKLGYNLLRGKQGKGKTVILIVAVIFGVLVGTFASDAFVLGQMISSGELFGWTYGDIPTLLIMLMGDSEYVTATLGNIGLGLLFAAIGVFALLRKTNEEVSGIKVVDLK